METCGCFASELSNFTSQLIRKALESEKDLRVIIFDIAGEYFVHLADIFKQTGTIYSTESFEGAKQFLESQVIHETLEGRLTGQPLTGIAEKLIVTLQHMARIFNARKACVGT